MRNDLVPETGLWVSWATGFRWHQFACPPAWEGLKPTLFTKWQMPIPASPNFAFSVSLQREGDCAAHTFLRNILEGFRSPSLAGRLMTAWLVHPGLPSLISSHPLARVRKIFSPLPIVALSHHTYPFTSSRQCLYLSFRLVSLAFSSSTFHSTARNGRIRLLPVVGWTRRRW